MQIIDVLEEKQSIENIIRIILNVAKPQWLLKNSEGWGKPITHDVGKYATIMTDEETLFKIYTKIKKELFDWRVIISSQRELPEAGREMLKGSTLFPSSGATTWFDKEKNFRQYAVTFSMTPIMNYFAELHGIDLVREEFELDEDAKLYLKARGTVLEDSKLSSTVLGEKPNGLGGSKS